MNAQLIIPLRDNPNQFIYPLSETPLVVGRKQKMYEVLRKSSFTEEDELHKIDLIKKETMIISLLNFMTVITISVGRYLTLSLFQAFKLEKTFLYFWSTIIMISAISLKTLKSSAIYRSKSCASSLILFLKSLIKSNIAKHKLLRP